MNNISNVAAVISAFAAAVAAIISAIQLYSAIKYQESKDTQYIKVTTIDAFNKLQEQVLDKFVSISKSDINAYIKYKNENKDFKIAYDDCRALIAKCEHFSVGVNNKVYDIDIVENLGGIHLINLYDKVKPVIDSTREKNNNKDIIYYKEFENLVKSLKDRQK